MPSHILRLPQSRDEVVPHLTLRLVTEMFNNLCIYVKIQIYLSNPALVSNKYNLGLLYQADHQIQYTKIKQLELKI